MGTVNNLVASLTFWKKYLQVLLYFICCFDTVAYHSVWLLLVGIARKHSCLTVMRIWYFCTPWHCYGSM